MLPLLHFRLDLIACAATAVAMLATAADGETNPAGSGAGFEPIKPLPAEVGADLAKVALGRQLFHEPRLSRDNSVSCASCHDLAAGGADGRVHSRGVGNADGSINAPTVFNVGLNFRQFWNGRAASLEDQLDGPITDAREMGSSWPEIVGKLRASPAYRQAFSRLYADGVQPRNIKDALATFERSLITPNARFDRFLRGETGALNAEEKAGYRKFKSYGCTSCHQGVNAGGNMFETLGAMADYFVDRGGTTTADFGRFNVTGREADRFVFRVPSLRNVALTAPYFHDGALPTLEAAVAAMGKYQLGEELAPADIAQIVAFLKTLTGEWGGQPL